MDSAFISASRQLELVKMPELQHKLIQRAVAVWTSVEHIALKYGLVYFASILISHLILINRQLDKQTKQMRGYEFKISGVLSCLWTCIPWTSF